MQYERIIEILLRIALYRSIVAFKKENERERKRAIKWTLGIFIQFSEIHCSCIECIYIT